MNTRDTKKDKWRLTVQDIATIGMMVAIIEVCKVVFMGLPNVELTTFWIIMFSIYFGNKVFWAIPVFILIEGAMFGFHIWWIMYLYMWPSLALLARILKKIDSVMAYSILSSAYGFLFGFFLRHSLLVYRNGRWRYKKRTLHCFYMVGGRDSV